MIRATAGAMAGPTGNGGAEAARVADAFREQDERRSEELNRLARIPVKAARRAAPGCEECGSKTTHARDCSRSPRAQLRALFAASQACGRCNHPLSEHRGIVCHGERPDGKRCKCDCGGRS